MRLAFYLTLLAASSIYTYKAFADLAFMNFGARVGPGFFPRIVGVLLVVTCLYTIVADRRKLVSNDEMTAYARTVAAMMGITLVFVAILDIFGGPLAMLVFMAAMLFYLNRGAPIANLVLCVAMPTAIYVLFHVWLNASMPEGLLGLPL